MAPTLEVRSPAPGWIETPPGVLEMENNWADYAHRFYSGTAVGGSYQGVQHIGMLRDLGDSLQEAAILRLPDNRMAFQARIVGGFLAKCHVRVEAVGEGRLLSAAWVTGSADSLESFHTVALVHDAQPPEILYSKKAVNAADRAVGLHIVGEVMSGYQRLDAVRLDPPRQMSGVWQSDGRSLREGALSAWDQSLFFSVVNSINGPYSPSVPSSDEIWAWNGNESTPPRALVPVTGTSAGQVGSGCGLGTDGETMVWTQASGWNGSTWDRIETMKAPFTTNPGELAPVRLRDAQGGIGACHNWTVGAGYAASLELLTKSLAAGQAQGPLVVRLSDGVAWQVPNRQGRRFGKPLYVTADEVVLEEALESTSDAGVTEFESWSIVRYPLSKLDPPLPP